MSIKYCEITIVINTENEDIFTNISRNWFGSETFYPESDIILTFEDNTICNINDEIQDLKFTFCQSSSYVLPLFFQVIEKIEKIKKFSHVYFYKEPIQIEEGENKDKFALNFSSIFSSKLCKYKTVSSQFNCIYYINKNQQVFSILKIFSNKNNPRFLLAYDLDEFKQEEIIYLVYCIFKNKFNTDI